MAQSSHNQGASTPPADSIAAIPSAVERALKDFLNIRMEEVEKIGAPVVESAGYLRDFVLGGGKRIRPVYAWAGFLGAGGLDKAEEDPQCVINAISSLELIQACALIHDDIIDASDTRRGNPTVHRAVESHHRGRGLRGDSSAYGRSTAILVGDFALMWAEDMWRYGGVSDEALRRAEKPWRAMRTEVIGGQLLDIVLEATGEESIELADRVNRYKTAAYTIERPLHLGAALAGASAKTIEAYRGYGRDIGIAFQLRDDLLGVFGDSDVTGKPAGDDLREGKRTVLLARALQLLDRKDPPAAQELRLGVGTTDDPATLLRLTELVRASGAVEDVEKRIQALTTSGLKRISDAGMRGDVAETLRALAIQATERRA